MNMVKVGNISDFLTSLIVATRDLKILNRLLNAIFLKFVLKLEICLFVTEQQQDDCGDTVSSNNFHGTKIQKKKKKKKKKKKIRILVQIIG